ncbi:PQQ-like beta-propeller repeat protein [Natrinema zhouii]|uniref:PQQ-binding-like beta-propeller repeat protein n=1 Tax=Natrinema zhouii TaxID=1710539 RepID=A0A7D6GSQ2_9EURY|nr:PQQ-binding-like beta-propeller repeat protein [Natrinema zhouii]QLK27482.1 PQQ-like beta-propeller repeat protein [Natrinema zhouii]
MGEWNRRSVLATGAALSAGGLASIGAGSEGDDAANLPDPDVSPNPEMVDEDWASFAGSAGHARFIEDGYEFDGDLEAVWTAADGELEWWEHRVPSVAVADGTVYATTHTYEEDPFGVAAYDAADGSLRWKNDDIIVSDPSVVGDTVYVTGEELFALDASDGSVRWQTEFNPEEPIQTQTVAYGAVFVVADGTLYALETDDGTVRWELDSVTASSRDSSEEALDLRDTTAAANGVVYAAVEAQSAAAGTRLALHPETGAEVWRNERLERGPNDTIRATETAVLFDSLSYARTIVDAQTGEVIVPEARSEGVDVVIGNEMFVGADDRTYEVGAIDPDDDTSWQVDINRDIVSSVISGDTVYTYFPGHELSDRPEYNKKLVAFDKYDGTEKWVIAESDLPVGPICAISDATIYVVHDGDLVALREAADDDDATDEDGANDDQDDANSEDEDADESDETDGDEDASEDTDEDDSSDESHDDDDGRGDGEDGSSDDGGTDDTETNGSDTDDSGGNGDGDADEDGSGDGGDADGDEQTVNGSTDAEADDDTDGSPGFTAGAGLLGGALGLEWLRRRDDADEPAE